MIELRYYQEDARTAVYDHLRTRDDNPCVVIPTAGGKTPLLASICRDAVCTWGGRVLILAHVKELLTQAAEKLHAICPEVDYGIYSASLNRREKRNPVIIAGIQSVYKRACELDAFDLILVDEAHMIPAEGEGMYRQFLADAKVVNPNVRVIGLTATPYRMKSGPICSADGILNHVCYEVGVRELIVKGYLCPLVAKAGQGRPGADRLADLSVRAGEFVADELEHLMDEDAVVNSACSEIVRVCEKRNAVLIFTCGIKHGEHVVSVLAEKTGGQEIGWVTGETPASQRDSILKRFKAGAFKYLVNVNVLTTGFDAPHIDCVALLRPTLSPGLYYQLVGRGFRIHPSKTDCLVLDYGDNVLRHGPVDCINPTPRKASSKGGTAAAKECPDCHAMIAIAFATCPNCGHAFPQEEEVKHDARAGTAAVVSGVEPPEVLPVSGVHYSAHVKKGNPDAPRTMRVDYEVGTVRQVSEWVCFEHEGFAWRKAQKWWMARSNFPMPETVAEAVRIANAGGLADTLEVTVHTPANERFERILDCSLGPIPDADAITVPEPRATSGIDFGAARKAAQDAFLPDEEEAFLADYRSPFDHLKFEDDTQYDEEIPFR